MTRYEKETVINFNEEEKTLEIETPNTSLQRKIESYGQNPTRIVSFEGVTFKAYKLPKNWLHIYAPRVHSEEERLKSRERALAMLQKRKEQNNDTV